MIKISVEISGKESVLIIGDIGVSILEKDIIPSIRMGTEGLKDMSDAEVLKELVSNLLKGFIRQKINLW